MNTLPSEKLSKTLPETSLYARRRITPNLLKALESKGVIVDDIDVKKKYSEKELTEVLLKNNTCTKSTLQDEIIQALGKSFDYKYAHYDYCHDARGVVENWQEDFFNVINQLNLNPDYNRLQKVIVVGAGNGEEGEHLYKDVNDLTLVDIAPESLRIAASKITHAKTICNSASLLKDVETEKYDLYVSLRTYNSAYFDLDASVKEAKRVLVDGGAIIISVANGFLDAKGNVIRGLINGKSNDVSEDVAWSKAIEIIRLLNKYKFDNPDYLVSGTEIYIFAKRK